MNLQGVLRFLLKFDQNPGFTQQWLQSKYKYRSCTDIESQPTDLSQETQSRTACTQYKTSENSVQIMEKSNTSKDEMFVIKNWSSKMPHIFAPPGRTKSNCLL